MKTVRSVLVILAVAVFAVTCSRQPTSPGATQGANSSTDGKGDGQGPTPSTATMQFGKANVGSPYPPPSGHDASGHAIDDLLPRTVVIRTGGTVTFQVPPNVHQLSIYGAGTKPDDIDTSIVTNLFNYAGCTFDTVVFAPLVINDPNNRIADYPIPCLQPATRTHTFSSSGKYLVICSFLPHFNGGMYGWVDVKD
jgi:plastocyanin